MSRSFAATEIRYGRMLPEDFYRTPGVQHIRKMAREILPKFRAWKIAARKSEWVIFRSPYAIETWEWENVTLKYVRKAVNGVIKGDDVYTYYMCAMAYHNLTAMALFLRIRAGYRLNFHYRKTTPGHKTVSLVDQLLTRESGDVDFSEVIEPIEDEIVEDLDGDEEIAALNTEDF